MEKARNLRITKNRGILEVIQITLRYVLQDRTSGHRNS